MNNSAQTEFAIMPQRSEKVEVRRQKAKSVAPHDAPAPELRTSHFAPLPSITTPWVKIPQPDGSYVLRPGKPVIQEDEIGTLEAAKILGLSQRRVEAMCDQDVLREGIDWRRNPGKQNLGRYRIKRASVIRLKGQE